jgi:hypothetical protein
VIPWFFVFRHHGRLYWVIDSALRISREITAYLLSGEQKMPMMLKLIGLYLFNLAGLCGLVVRGMRPGRTFFAALRGAWAAILAGTGENGSHDPVSANIAAIVTKTWWMMIFITLLLWVRETDRGYGYALIGLGLVHLGGYWWSLFSGTRALERIETLDPGWGIIHLTVREHSFFNAKSLAELDLRKKNLLILAIVRGENIVPFPKGAEILIPGDRLVIFGDLDYYMGMKT